MSNDLLPSSQLPGVTRFQWQQLLGPIFVVVIVAYAASSVSASFAFLTEGTLALLVMVLALQVLIGNSGVLSFGQAAFAMVGGFAADTARGAGPDRCVAGAYVLDGVQNKEWALYVIHRWVPLLLPAG